MTTNKRKKKPNIQGGTGGGGQKSAGSRLRAETPKGSSGKPHPFQAGKVGRKGGARH